MRSPIIEFQALPSRRPRTGTWERDTLCLPKSPDRKRMNGVPALRVGRIPYANLLPIFHALEDMGPPEGVAYIRGTRRS